MRSTTPRARRRSRDSAIAAPSVSISWNLSEDEPALRTRMRTSVTAGRDAQRAGARAQGSALALLRDSARRYLAPRRRDLDVFVPFVRFVLVDSLFAAIAFRFASASSSSRARSVEYSARHCARTGAQ